MKKICIIIVLLISPFILTAQVVVKRNYSANQENYYSRQNDNSTDVFIVDNSRTGEWKAAMEIGYGFLQNDNWTYRINIGANYVLPSNLYLGARIGYNAAMYSQHSPYYQDPDLDLEYNMVGLPLEVGYFIGSGKFGLVPFGGIDLNIGVSGKSEFSHGGSTDTKKLKVKGKCGVGLSLGLRLRLGEFNISGIYHLPLNEKQEMFFGEDAYPEITIGWGF